MSTRTETEPTLGDVALDIAAMLAGLGIIVMVLFPFALPALILGAVVLIPLLALALLVARVAAPGVAVRALRRRRKAVRREHTAPGLAPSARPVGT